VSHGIETYAPGDRVRVVDGPFSNYEAQVQAVDARRGRLDVAVAVSFRAVPIKVELHQIEKIG